MSGQRLKMTAAAVVVAICFVVGLTRLFLLRFEAGDVYPAYSSLRSDPLGTRVLLESLNVLADHSARRNFSPPDQISLSDQSTLVVCGLRGNGYFLNYKAVKALMDAVAESGGRLVLAFSSRLTRPDKDTGSEAEDAENPDGGNQPAGPLPDSPVESAEDKPDEWLGAESMGFGFKQGRLKAMDETAFLEDSGIETLPDRIPWRTTLFFDIKDEAWRTVYTWQRKPVVLERPWGHGSVVIAADSYLFSNEALRRHRLTDWLVWAIGPDRHVIFDEFHHGLANRPGIAGLARQYRLHAFIGALLLVVALFVWRQAAVFVPPVRMAQENERLAIGRDTGQGVVDLMRQHIPPAELLTVCFDTWRSQGNQRVPDELADRIAALVRSQAAGSGSNDPVETYRRICELLKQGKGT